VTARSDLPRMALFIADLGGGGAERIFVNLANSLSHRGYGVDLVVGNLDNAAYSDELSRDVRLVNLRVRRMAFGAPSLIKYIRREKPTVILATRDHSSCLAFLACKLSRMNTKIVFRQSNTINVDLRAMSPIRMRFLFRVMQYCYPRADRVIAVSQSVADDLAKKLCVPQEILSVVYSPIITPSLNNLAAAPLDHHWFREDSPPVILSVGRLTAQKDQETLIRAFKLVRTKLDTKLLILGEGEKRAELESLVSKLGLAADVSMPGFHKNPFAFMARSRLFVLSSAWEGLPGALIQAVACGCPVVSTDCPGGSREILRNGRLGSLVPVGDVESMADAILKNLSGERTVPCSPQELDPYTVDYSTREYIKILLS